MVDVRTMTSNSKKEISRTSSGLPDGNFTKWNWGIIDAVIILITLIGYWNRPRDGGISRTKL